MLYGQVSHNPAGAACIMTCWPFCFFPFLFPAPTQEHVHCSLCGYYFGMYDYQEQVMNDARKPRNQENQLFKKNQN